MPAPPGLSIGNDLPSSPRLSPEELSPRQLTPRFCQSEELGLKSPAADIQNRHASEQPWTGVRSVLPPPRGPPEPIWQYEHITARFFIGFLDLLRFLNWFTELFKVLFNRDGAGNMYGWACFTLLTSSYLVIQRFYDQVYVLFRALKVGKESRRYFNICTDRPGLSCFCLPVTIAFAPVTTMAFTLYESKARHFHKSAAATSDMTVFTKRPLGTILLGLPLYSIVSHCMMGKELVHHPIQIHVRTMQNLFQTTLEDLPCIIIDPLIIFNAGAVEDVFWFWVSFVYSILHTMVICSTTAAEVHHHEHHVTMIGSASV